MAGIALRGQTEVGAMRKLREHVFESLVDGSTGCMAPVASESTVLAVERKAGLVVVERLFVKLHRLRLSPEVFLVACDACAG